MSLKGGCSDQTSIFEPTIRNIVIYRPYVLQNIDVLINYKNTEFIKNKLCGNYGLCSDN